MQVCHILVKWPNGPAALQIQKLRGCGKGKLLCACGWLTSFQRVWHDVPVYTMDLLFSEAFRGA